MRPLRLFGLVTVTVMLACYARSGWSPWFVLAFALACVMASADDFVQGAWPFGVVEAIWSAVAVRRWRVAR